MQFKKTVFTMMLLSSIFISAQQTADKELGAWYMLGAQHSIFEKFTLKGMAHFRFFDLGDDFQQFASRLGGNYKVTKNFNVTLGYAFFNTDSTFGIDGGGINEHRVYEDFNLKHKIGKGSFSNRIMIEHRFSEINTTHWFRYKFGFSHPIANNWSGYVFNETFFFFEGKNFSQNWAGLGAKYKLTNAIQLQLGYLKILTSRTDFDRLQFGISFKTK